MFNHPEFGELRTVEISGEPWFVGKDVATALGYANPSNAVSVHVDKEDKTSYLIQVSGSNYKANTALSTNPVSTPLSSAASSHLRKTSNTGLQVKFERQGDIVKGGENFTLPEIPMII